MRQSRLLNFEIAALRPCYCRVAPPELSWSAGRRCMGGGANCPWSRSYSASRSFFASGLSSTSPKYPTSPPSPTDSQFARIDHIAVTFGNYESRSRYQVSKIASIAPHRHRPTRGGDTAGAENARSFGWDISHRPRPTGPPCMFESHIARCLARLGVERLALTITLYRVARRTKPKDLRGSTY